MFNIMFYLFALLPTPLNYSDFKGSGMEAAYTASEIDLLETETDGRYTFSVNSYFVPEESYINVKTERILNHERGHMAITTIWANRITEGLKKYQKGKNDKAANQYFKAMIRKWKWCQKSFDMQTNHSIDEFAEKRWEKYISNGLAR